MITAIEMIGIFFGVLARSLAPYFRKVREGKVKSFHKRHLASSVGSLILGIIITLLIFPQFQASAPNGGLDVYIKLFCTAFGFGFGWHAIVSEVASWFGAFRAGEECLLLPLSMSTLKRKLFEFVF